MKAPDLQVFPKLGVERPGHCRNGEINPRRTHRRFGAQAWFAFGQAWAPARWHQCIRIKHFQCANVGEKMPSWIV
jgi:hypothetical protein